MAVRLSRLLVVDEPSEDDWRLMKETAEEALLDPFPGLPRRMAVSARAAAHDVLAHQSWADYQALCLMAVQARPGDEDRERLELRIELEQIFFELLFGPAPSAEEARRLGTPRRSPPSR